MNSFDIKTTAIQGIDGQTETVSTSSRGSFKRTADGFVVRYREKVMEDAPPVFTEITVLPDKTVTVTKDGGISSRLIIAEGRANDCLYSTPVGNMTLTVSGQRINYLLTDSGGEIFLSYHISQGGRLISRNQVTIRISR